MAVDAHLLGGPAAPHLPHVRSSQHFPVRLVGSPRDSAPQTARAPQLSPLNLGAHCRGAALDDLCKSLPTQTIQRIYDISSAQAPPRAAFTWVQPTTEAKWAPCSLPEGWDDEYHRPAPRSGNQVPKREPRSPSIQDSHRSCPRGGHPWLLLTGRPMREADGACQEQDSREAKHGLESTEGQAGAGCTLGGHVRDRQTD